MNRTKANTIREIRSILQAVWKKISTKVTEDEKFAQEYKTEYNNLKDSKEKLIEFLKKNITTVEVNGKKYDLSVNLGQKTEEPIIAAPNILPLLVDVIAYYKQKTKKDIKSINKILESVEELEAIITNYYRKKAAVRQREEQKQNENDKQGPFTVAGVSPQEESDSRKETSTTSHNLSCKDRIVNSFEALLKMLQKKPQFNKNFFTLYNQMIAIKPGKSQDLIKAKNALSLFLYEKFEELQQYQYIFPTMVERLATIARSGGKLEHLNGDRIQHLKQVFSRNITEILQPKKELQDKFDEILRLNVKLEIAERDLYLSNLSEAGRENLRELLEPLTDEGVLGRGLYDSETHSNSSTRRGTPEHQGTTVSKIFSTDKSKALLAPSTEEESGPFTVAGVSPQEESDDILPASKTNSASSTRPGTPEHQGTTVSKIFSTDESKALLAPSSVLEKSHNLSNTGLVFTPITEHPLERPDAPKPAYENSVKESMAGSEGRSTGDTPKTPLNPPGTKPSSVSSSASNQDTTNTSATQSLGWTMLLIKIIGLFFRGKFDEMKSTWQERMAARKKNHDLSMSR
jgi:hypothetical protein